MHKPYLMALLSTALLGQNGAPDLDKVLDRAMRAMVCGFCRLDVPLEGDKHIVLGLEVPCGAFPCEPPRKPKADPSYPFRGRGIRRRVVESTP